MSLSCTLIRAYDHICWKLHIDGYKHASDATFLKMRYRKRLDSRLHLDKPVLFSEKMQWLKIHNRNADFTRWVDKYEAKDMARKFLGDQYVTPLLGVWDNFDDIDFSALPEKFVLKCTHDSGGLVICQDKAKLNIAEAKNVIERSLHTNYYSSSREWPYKDVKPRIIAEEYLENDSDGLHDYKIWCFNGEPEYVQFITGRIGNHTYEGFYDKEWILQNFSYHNLLMKEPIPKPDCLDELLTLARKMAEGLPFVRCDFYVLEDGSIRFGEMTFFPMSGMEHWHPDEMDRIMGEKIDLTLCGS